MVNEYWHTVKDGKVYDSNWSYLWHQDIVYGSGSPKWWILTNKSEATANPQPSKEMNANSNKINWANPSSPSTNPATRSAEYNQFQKIMANQNGGWYATDPYAMYNTSNKTNTSNYTRPDTLWGATAWGSDTTSGTNGTSGTSWTSGTNGTNWTSGTKSTGWLDLTLKWNFDTYQPIDRQSQSGIMQQYYLQANNDIQATRRWISKLMLQEDALNSKSWNLNEVTTLIDAVENAYDRGVFDTQTIANQLWVSPEAVSLIQQWKANELVKLNEDYVKEQMKWYERQRSDLDIDMQRTMENYNLQKTNLDAQYNSAVQTLKRNLFDAQRASKTGSAIAGVSGSEYALGVIQAKHDQAMGDLDNNYMYSSMQQKYQYTRAMEDYNKAIERLSEDFDSDLKNIQASVLQQFQEIDNKIGLSTQQLAQIYGTLEQNVLNAKTSAVSSYMQALADWETNFANAIAQISWLDTTQFSTTVTEWNFKYNPITTQALTGWLNTFVDNLWDKIKNHAKIRGWQCGALVNDYLTSMWYWHPIWDAKSTKLNLKNTNTPKVWSVAIWEKTWTEAWDKYGHVAIVTSVNDDWTVTVLEQNANTGLRYRTYKQSNIYWYFDPTIWSEQKVEQQKTDGKEEIDYSGLTEEQIYDVGKIVTEVLWSTQAGKDVKMHNNVAQMMRDWKTTEQIIKAQKDRLFWDTLDAYPETKSITQFLWSSLTKTQKEDFQDSIKDAISNNNPQEAFSFIKTTIKNNMNADDKKKTSWSELAKMHLLEIQELYDQFIAAGGETWWLSGEYEEMLQKFWKTSDPKLLEISNKIARAIQSYRHDISGAAFTESEAKEYKKVFPGIEQDEEVFRTNLKSWLDYADNEINYYYDTQLWGTGKYKALQEELSKIRTVENKEETVTNDVKNTYSFFWNIKEVINMVSNKASSYTWTNTVWGNWWNSVFTNSWIYVSNWGVWTWTSTTYQTRM